MFWRVPGRRSKALPELLQLETWLIRRFVQPLILYPQVLLRPADEDSFAAINGLAGNIDQRDRAAAAIGIDDHLPGRDCRVDLANPNRRPLERSKATHTRPFGGILLARPRQRTKVAALALGAKQRVDVVISIDCRRFVG